LFAFVWSGFLSGLEFLWGYLSSGLLWLWSCLRSVFDLTTLASGFDRLLYAFASGFWNVVEFFTWGLFSLIDFFLTGGQNLLAGLYAGLLFLGEEYYENEFRIFFQVAVMIRQTLNR
jgi:hypothetical protein